MPVACALIPRFRLIAALGERREISTGAMALAPEPGAAQLIGEVSAPAEAVGLRPGMRLGEALTRCPELVLVPPDPERAERCWEQLLRRLQGIGAEVESERAGEAFFEADGLRALWGGIEAVLARVRRELGPAARLAAAPGRFCAYAAATGTRAGKRTASPPRSRAMPTIVPARSARRFLAPLPVSLLHGRLRDPATGRGDFEEATGADDLPNELERLGIETLGRLADLPRAAVGDRFGHPGLRALRLARGEDHPLRPRLLREPLTVDLELPEAASGQQLERALELLISRLLAHRERRDRTVRALRLSARLVAGGGWRLRVALRRATAEREHLAVALLPRLTLLPGPAGGEQLALAGPEEDRRRRISEAVRQVRTAAGPDAVLRVLEVDPDSRLPERRDALMPFPEESA